MKLTNSYILNRLTVVTTILFIFGPKGYSSKIIIPRSNYDLALKEAGKHEYRQAIDYLQQQIAKDSSFTEAYLRMAQFFRYDNNLQNGKLYFHKALQENSENSNLYLGFALISKYSNDWKSSFENCKEALNKGSTSYVTIDLLIESAFKLNKTDSLPIILRKLKRVPSQKHLYDLGYAIWRIRIKNFNRAKSTLVNYLKSNQDAYGYKLLGEVYQQLNDFDSATASFLQANQFVDQTMKYFKISLWRDLGRNYFEAGKLDSADYYFTEALELAQKIGALIEELEINKASASIFKKNEMYQKLAESCLNGIQISLALKETEVLPNFYFDLAFASAKMGDRNRALRYYKLSKNEAKKSQDTKLIVKALMERARILMEMQEWDEALKNLYNSMAVAKKSNLSDLIYLALQNIADVHSAQGKIDSAKNEYQKVLRYAQKTQQHQITERCFIQLARLYMHPGSNLNHAKYYLAMADALARQTLQLQYAANNRWMEGTIALLQNDIEKAETYFFDAIQLGKDTGSYGAILAGNAGLIKTYLKADFPELATARFDSALKYLNDYGNLYIDENTMHYFDLSEDLFVPAVEAYSKTGQLAKIYDIFETYKAIKHIDNISAIKYKIKSSPASALEREFSKINKQIHNKWTELWTLWRRDKGDNLNLVMQIKNDIHRLLDARKANQQNLAQTDPGYYSLVQPKTESLISLRTKLENLNGSLLHYFVGENITNILLVRPDSIFYKQVNFGRTYLKELVKQISPLFSNNPFGLSDNINAKNDLFRLDLAGELYKIIFEPIRAWIPAQSTLFISADDILNRVPFECLVTNPDMLTDMYDYYNIKFLVEDFEISYIPYAKFLDWPIKKQKRPQKSFIAFAGPAYFSMNFLPRIPSVNNPDIPGNNHSDYPLDSVRNKENEIFQIAQIVGKNVSKLFTGQKSTKNRFLTESSKYRVLHLALPAIMEDNSPLYSKIFFSNYKDTPEFLETFELLNLNLNAAMVVLSSSNILAGKLNDAAGVKGLAHAFNYAGVPSMVTSLWNVNGNASFEVLAKFYSNLKLGMVKSAALQQAKVSYIQTINRNPYYWAGYILVGNPQSIEIKSPDIDFLIYIALAGVLALIAVIIWQFLRIKKESS